MPMLILTLLQLLVWQYCHGHINSSIAIAISTAIPPQQYQR